MALETQGLVGVSLAMSDQDQLGHVDILSLMAGNRQDIHDIIILKY